MSSDFNNLFEHISTADVEEDKKYSYFVQRTEKHIELVEKAAKQIVDMYPEFKELLTVVKNHDASKFEEPELIPYIELSWDKKNNPNKKPSQEVTNATLHHIKHNRHHPEYWLEDKEEANINQNDRDKSDKVVDASKMEDLYIAEMVCDWQAMSEELKTNTVREWYNKVNGVRWSFSDKQNKLIDKLIKVFEKE
jgi:hypothetical protein